MYNFLLFFSCARHNAYLKSFWFIIAHVKTFILFISFRSDSLRFTYQRYSFFAVSSLSLSFLLLNCVYRMYILAEMNVWNSSLFLFSILKINKLLGFVVFHHLKVNNNVLYSTIYNMSEKKLHFELLMNIIFAFFGSEQCFDKSIAN